MASSKPPKFIPISRGEHEFSPHFASLRPTEVDDIFDFSQNTPKHVPAQQKNTAAHVEVDLLKGLHKENAKPAPIVRAALNPSFAPAAPTPIPEPKQKQKQKTKAKKTHAVKSLHRASAMFVLIAFVLVTPLKALTTFEQLRAAETSVEDLKASTAASAHDLSNFSQASSVIDDALRQFHAAQTSLSGIDSTEDFVLQHIPVLGEKFGVATRLVNAGEHVSLAAASYMQLFRTLKERSDAPLIERLNLFFDGNRAVVSDLDQAADLVRPIDVSGLPDSQQKLVSTARDAILALDNDATYLASAGPVILSTLGTTQPRRYLIVFQNPTEMRPTGGFIGSFALIDIKNGEITKMEVPPGGSYDLQGSLKNQIYAPLPLHIVNPRWEFQDGNWFPDFPTSAKKLMWFLEKSQGPSVDGVIAINATVLPELLAVVGPIHVDGSDQTLDANSALSTLRDSITEKALDHNTKPKSIITDAAPALINTLKAGKAEHFLPVITTLLKALETREIQLYTSDTDTEAQIASFGWDGAVRDNPNGDYLQMITTNIGGQKTDAVISQTIDHQAKIADDGSIEVSVRVSRTQLKSDRVLEDAPNISYLRFYVPDNSTLVSADGFTFPDDSLFQGAATWEKPDTDLETIEQLVGTDEKSGTRITREFGHMVFGNWMITQPGGSAEAMLTYKLPFKMTPQAPNLMSKIAGAFGDSTQVASYSLYVQRQSGTQNTRFSSRVILPDNWQVGAITDTRATLAENGALISVPFDHDISYAITSYAKTNSQN